MGSEDLYAKGLYSLSSEQELPELKETVKELSRLAEVNEGNGELQIEYASGLFNLSCEQELSDRKETIGELMRLAAENRENAEIQTIYTKVMDIFGSD